MANIFGISAGLAAVVTDPNALPFYFKLGIGGSEGTSSAIVQKVSIKTKTNYQTLQTLNDYSYIYVFGEYPGEAEIQGICLPRTCVGGGSNLDGLSQAINYYAWNCLSFYKNWVFLGIGAAVFRSFIVGGTFGIIEPAHNIGQFSLHIITAPP